MILAFKVLLFVAGFVLVAIQGNGWIALGVLMMLIGNQDDEL